MCDSWYVRMEVRQQLVGAGSLFSSGIFGIKFSHQACGARALTYRVITPALLLMFSMLS